MDGGTYFGDGHDDLFLIIVNRSTGVGFLGFRVPSVVATAAAVVFVFFLARTAPDEKHRNAQYYHQRKKVHGANIAAIGNRANGILHPGR
jgi:hypothetical protein